jgi:hypothetical protein
MPDPPPGLPSLRPAASDAEDAPPAPPLSPTSQRLADDMAAFERASGRGADRATAATDGLVANAPAVPPQEPTPPPPPPPPQ